MEVSISTSLWKYALLTLIIFITLVDIALMSCGVETLGGVGSVSGAYIVASFGGLIFVLCTVGCFASIRESKILTQIYIVFAVVCIIMQTVYMITFAVLKDDFVEMAEQRIENAWEQEKISDGAMDNIQQMFSCCGKDNPQDHLTDDDDEQLPESCCIFKDCSMDVNIFTRGCVHAAVSIFQERSGDLILIMLSLTGLEVLSLATGYYFISGLNRKLNR